MAKAVFRGIPFYLALAVAIAVYSSVFADFPYWIAPSVVDVGKFVLIMALALSFVWTIIQGVQRKSRPLVIAMVSLIFIVGANSLFWGLLVLDRLLSGVYLYRGDIEFNESRYYVTSSWKPGIGMTLLSSFWLHKCDTSGINCETVYEQEYRKIPRRDYEAMTVHLLPDPATNTLALEINGEVVYTHQP